MKFLRFITAILLFCAINSSAQTGVATQSLQTRGNLYLDSINKGNKSYIATLTFTASSAAGAYTNLTSINSSTSTSANVTSFSVSLPNGKYKLISANAIVTSTASPTFEVWLFSSAVTTAGDKQNISGNLSNSDMQKFVGDLRFDGTWAGNGAVNKGNGRIGNYSALNMPIVIDITNNQFHCILVARASWTPSTSAYHQLLFYLERASN